LVKDFAAFSSSHLPRYVKHSNFQSFIRQLNTSCFHTVKEHASSDASVAFRRRFFERQRRDVLSNVKRAKKQGGNYNHRFDVMQQQIKLMSRMMSPLGKRRRKDDASSGTIPSF
jgi:hypothetical protein